MRKMVQRDANKKKEIGKDMKELICKYVNK